MVCVRNGQEVWAFVRSRDQSEWQRKLCIGGFHGCKTHWERVPRPRNQNARWCPDCVLELVERAAHSPLSPSLTLAVVNQHFALRAELFGIRTPVCGLIRQPCRVVTMSHTQISLYPMRSDSNTTFLPSGEKLGLPLNPFADKIRVGGAEAWRSSFRMSCQTASRSVDTR